MDAKKDGSAFWPLRIQRFNDSSHVTPEVLIVVFVILPSCYGWQLNIIWSYRDDGDLLLLNTQQTIYTLGRGDYLRTIRRSFGCIHWEVAACGVSASSCWSCLLISRVISCSTSWLRTEWAFMPSACYLRFRVTAVDAISLRLSRIWYSHIVNTRIIMLIEPISATRQH